MRGAFKKLLLAFFDVLIIVPAGFLAHPQRADAFIGCLSGLIFNKVAGAVQGVASDLTKVPVSESTVAKNTRNTAGHTQGTLIKECALDAVAKGIAKAALQSFTASVVKWINSGFRGKPAFLTNPEGFLIDIADREFGREIDAIAPFLCSPFRFDLKLALGLQYGYETRDEVRCRLSDVIANVENSYSAFVAGDFREGGWNNWINIAGTQQNNPYGSYLNTVSKVDARLVSATGEEIQLLNFGKGFMSWRKCEEYEIIKDPKTNKEQRGKCLKQGKLLTPGSIIESQTSGTLQSTLRELEVADEIDEIFGALVNQLLVRTLGPGGLFGNTEPDSGGGPSYVEQLARTADPVEAERRARARPPEGIDCRLEYLAKSATEREVMLVTYATAEGKITRSAGTVATMPDNATPIVNPLSLADGKPDWTTYFQNMRDGCRNQLNQFAERQEGQFVSGLNLPTAGTTGAQPPAVPQEGNISQGKKVTQSSTFRIGEGTDGREWRYRPGPEHAVDSSKEGSTLYGLAFTEFGKTEWWSVDLAADARSDKSEWEIQEINKIKVYGPSVVNLEVNHDRGIFSSGTVYSAQFRVIVTNANPALSIDEAVHRAIVAETKTIDSGRGNNFVEIPTASGTKGRYVVISQFPQGSWRGDYLGIAEVEVFGKQTRIDPNAPPPIELLTVSLDPPRSEAAPREAYQLDAITGAVTLSANKTANNLKLQFQLFSNGVEVPWRNVFQSFFVSVAPPFESAKTSPNFVSIDANGEMALNPLVCETANANRKLVGECNGTAQKTGVPITFNEPLSLTGSNRIPITVRGQIRQGGAFVPPHQFEIRISATNLSGVPKIPEAAIVFMVLK